MFPIALALAACSADYAHSQRIDTNELLPELDELCTPDAEDTEKDGVRVVSWIEPEGDSCRAALYARVVAADWAEVDKSIEESVPTKTKVSWPEAGVELERLWVQASGDVAPPIGTRVIVEQLVSTDSRRQGDFDADPVGLVAALEDGSLASVEEHFLGIDYEIQGNEADTLDAPVSPPHAKAIDLINASYEQDPEMYLVSVASVLIPLEALAALGGTELRVQISEEMSVTAEIKLDWF